LPTFSKTPQCFPFFTTEESMLKTNRYRVTIHADGKLYRTTGAITVTSVNPMANAARALLSQGAEPSATLAGSFEGMHISPTQLHRLARPYSPPRVNHRASDPSRNAA
jgi:hypothetical protein